MVLDTDQKVNGYLLDKGIITSDTGVELLPLGGGVSNHVWKIHSGQKRWVLKQALHKLKVKADWYSDVERIHREHEVMEAIVNHLPAGTVPRVVHKDNGEHLFIMTCADDTCRTWKQSLMDGDFDARISATAGTVLRLLHDSSGKISMPDREKFADQKYFLQLRVDPFHRHLARRYPELDEPIQRLITEITSEATCLVHGDFSPKNMLVGPHEQFMLIDYEVGHWGNPVFDMAYCVAHLMLKGWHLGKKDEAVKLIKAFIGAYGRDPGNLVPHLGLMLLARMDGKSPVDYIRDPLLKEEIRRTAFRWIREKGNVPAIDAIGAYLLT